MESRVERPGAAASFPWRFIGWGGAVALILAPLVAMQFTSEVDWNLWDFLIMGVLIGGIGLAFELMVRASSSRTFRAGAALALLTAFLMIWSNLAVGIIGSEETPGNLLFFAVVAIGIAGGYASRFRADGMVRTMIAVAFAQLFLSGLALALGERDGIVAAGFALPMLVSAALFRITAKAE